MIVTQYHVGEITPARQECLDQLRLSIPNGIGYEMITQPINIPDYPGEHSLRRDSGFARLMLLKENPNRMWIDTDVKCIQWPEIEEGKPFIYQGRCPASVMYLKGCETIDTMLSEFLKTTFLCMHYLLFRYVKYTFIPMECFNHLQLATR
jgi:hypothetical protein